MKTREGQDFLCINGIQTMSAQTYDLLAEIPNLKAMGIDVIRLCPQPQYTPEIIKAFKQACHGQPAVSNQNWNPSGLVDGYWHGKPGIDQVTLAT